MSKFAFRNCYFPSFELEMNPENEFDWDWLRIHYGFWDYFDVDFAEHKVRNFSFCNIYGRGSGFRSKVNSTKYLQ